MKGGIIELRKLLLIPVLFIVFILVIVLLLGGNPLHVDREGDIIQTSSDANELMRISPFLSLLDGNIESCQWYFQVADRSGSVFFRMYDYCYNGEVVLKGDYFDSISNNYKWIKYDYEQHRSLNEDYFVLIPMYEISMIRESLKTKQLYVCDDPLFSNDDRYYTFLDKENRTLYFYWFAL